MLLGLRIGDPADELAAWLSKESVRDVYLTADPAEAAVLIDKAIIIACRADDVPRSSRWERPWPGGWRRS